MARARENRKGNGPSGPQGPFLLPRGQDGGKLRRPPIPLIPADAGIQFFGHNSGQSLGPRCRGDEGLRLLLELPLEDLDLFGQGHIGSNKTFDLANRVQHRGVVAAAETPADLRQ